MFECLVYTEVRHSFLKEKGEKDEEDHIPQRDLSTRTPARVTTTRLRLRVPKQGTKGILEMVWMKFQTLNFGKNSITIAHTPHPQASGLATMVEVDTVDVDIDGEEAAVVVYGDGRALHGGEGDEESTMVATTTGGQREPEGEPDERVGPAMRNPLMYEVGGVE